MECKFIEHGLAFGYSKNIKPCCLFKTDSNWQKQNNLQVSDITNWHKSESVKSLKKDLSANIFPKQCATCEDVEKHGTYNSLRQDSLLSYNHYDKDDITLEIRPGITCNFSCQTCWPYASSRVKEHYKKANLLDFREQNHKVTDFEFLNPIAKRIKDVIILGGEPFYDKNCRNFFNYAGKNLTSTLTIFTNGSVVDFEFLKNYKGKIILVFSMDAIEKPSEYIRFGSNWNIVSKNFIKAQQYENVEVRVNITVSIYNIYYVSELLLYLYDFWSNTITFSYALEDHFKIKLMPKELRNNTIIKMNDLLKKIIGKKLDKNQKLNLVHNCKYILQSLQNDEWDSENFVKWQNFTHSMNKVKNINIKEYSDFLTNLLDYQSN